MDDCFTSFEDYAKDDRTLQFRDISSHVQSLGVDNSGRPVKGERHVVGQESARTALFIVRQMVEANKFSGRLVILAGPPECGKTSAAMALSKELGKDTPFVVLNASSIPFDDGAAVGKIDTFVRRSIAVKLREIKETYEGEVMSVTDERTVTLRSRKGSMLLTLPPNEEDVRVGDVLYVEGDIVKKVGRSESRKCENDLDTTRYVPQPKGDVMKRKERITYATLHDMDITQGNSRKAREDVNAVMNRYVEKGVAQVFYGILFIDEAQRLSKFILSYLHKVSESSISPLVILSTNTLDFFDSDILSRALIIKMEKLTKENIMDIIRMRSMEEEVTVDEESVDFLCSLCQARGLRYGLTVLTVTKLLGKTINIARIKEVAECFSSAAVR